MVTQFLLIGVAVVATVSLIVYSVSLYNGLVFVRNNLRKSWGNIDVLLKQRHDEIPKLIKTCEAYMAYEKETLSHVVRLRASSASAHGVAEVAEAEGALTGALHRLFALAENYPDLKAQGSFLQLQQRIASLEDNLSDRRELYNESVNNFNVRIESFPDSILASLMRLRREETFRVTEAERQDVSIEFRLP